MISDLLSGRTSVIATLWRLPGLVAVAVNDAGIGGVSTVTSWATGADTLDRRALSPLYSAVKEYEPGDTAELLVQAPFAGHGLLTISRNGIVSINLSVPGDRMAVSISPGAMALTRMPCGPKSAAISRVSEPSAAFDVA